MADTQLSAPGLARKLTLLMDVAATLDHAPTFIEIQAALAADGVRLSRARWGYMIAGTGTVVRDRAVLTALSRFFGVGEDFLCTDSENVPPAVAARLDLVRALRAARVKQFAMRTLGDIAPDTLQAITRFLDDEILASGTMHEDAGADPGGSDH